MDKEKIKQILEFNNKMSRILQSEKVNTVELRRLNSAIKGLLLSELYKKEISLTATLRKK